MRKVFWLIITTTLLVWSCGGPEGRPTEWAIPANQVFDGGVGQDGIASINQPNFSSVDEVDFLI